jgi:nucleotide-binding universal stress UspA family protein
MSLIRSPTAIPCEEKYPRFASTAPTYGSFGRYRRQGPAPHGAMSNMAMIRPLGSQNATDSGIVVSFIQNASCTGRPNANAIPASGPSELLPESPRSWSSCEEATSTFSVAEPSAVSITTFECCTGHADDDPHATSSMNRSTGARSFGITVVILPHMGGRIVVGVDGSPESVAALRWAGEEARIRGATLVAVTAWENSQVAAMGMPGGLVPPDLSPQLKQGAEELQQAALREAGIDPGEVEGSVREGGAAGVLLDAARGSDMLVVGSRGHGGFKELMLGSVSQQCAHHAACPVVIVRSDATS